MIQFAIGLIILIFAWFFLLCSVAFPPVLLIMILRKIISSRKVTVIISAIIIIATCLTLFFILQSPIIQIPEEYQGYIDDAEMEQICSITKGIYLPRTPRIAVCARVDFASDKAIDFVIQYYPFGRQNVHIDGDGIYESAIF